MDGSTPMTGALSAPVIRIVNDGTTFVVFASTAGVILSRLISEPITNTIRFRLHLDDGSYNDLILGEGSVFPNPDTKLTLGRPTARWNDIYAVNSAIQQSDGRTKENIIPLDSNMMLVFLKALNPVQYNFIDGQRPHYGLIAQEVEQAMKDCGIDDFAGFIKSPVLDDGGNDTGEVVYGLRYSEFIALLINVSQNHEERIASLETRLEAAGI